MAISHAQPLLVLLLVSLFFLPALGNVVEFKTCEEDCVYLVNVTTVDISPWPVTRSSNAKITITGVTSENITSDVRVYVAVDKRSKNYQLCDKTACPIAPGPIVLTFDNLFTHDQLIRGRHGTTVRVWIPHRVCVLFHCPITSF